MIGFEKLCEWFTNVLCVLTVLLIFQFSVTPAFASPINFHQSHHTDISETYVYDEIESSVGEVDLTGGLSRVLSVKGVRPVYEVLEGVASVVVYQTCWWNSHMLFCSGKMIKYGLSTAGE